MQNENLNDNSSITLGDLLKMIKKNIIFVLIVILLFLGGGIFYTFKLVTPTYKSTTTIVVAVKNPGGSSSGNVDYVNSLRLVYTVAHFTTEDAVLDTVAEEFNTTSENLRKLISCSTTDNEYMYTISVVYKDPKMTRDIANKVFESLDMQCKTNDVIKIFDVSVGQATPATEGIYNSPNKTLYIIVSLIIGFVVAFVIVFMKELLSNKYKNKKDIELTIPEKIIAVFPDNKSLGKDNKNISLIEPTMTNIEPYNILSTNIKYLNLENPYKVILCTSTEMNELKTTIVVNLAYSLALNNKKVCIIDLDTRRPTVHKAYDISIQNGLVEYVSGDATKEEIIKHTKEGVDVITRGREILNPLVLLESTKLKDLINELKQEYDYILLDTPPYLAASDVLVASKLCDGIIYNIAMNQTHKKLVQEGLNSLRDINSTIIGVVLTKAIVEKSDSKYYYYKDNIETK